MGILLIMGSTYTAVFIWYRQLAGLYGCIHMEMTVSGPLQLYVFIWYCYLVGRYCCIYMVQPLRRSILLYSDGIFSQRGQQHKPLCSYHAGCQRAYSVIFIWYCQLTGVCCCSHMDCQLAGFTDLHILLCSYGIAIQWVYTAVFIRCCH